MTAATREIELKLEVRPIDLERLRRHPRVRALSQGRARTQTLRSVYYDTPGLSLARQGISLRVRRVGKDRIQTVKTRGASTAGLFVRGEWESPVDSDQPDLERVADPALRALLRAEAADTPLEATIETEFRRTRRHLRLGDAQLLFDLDVGEVRARGQRAPLCELELELVAGGPRALFDLALELSETISLRPATRGKADVGMELLTGERPVARRARKVVVPDDASLEDVLCRTAERCLEQILANERPAREGVDPEGVHQLRVGARRLRSALSLFEPLLPAEQVKPLRDELKWLAGELGPARDLDVFLDGTFSPILRRFPGDGGLKRLRDGAIDLRERGYERARHAIGSPRQPRLALALGRWIATRAWRDGLSPADLARLQQPAGPGARELLERRARKATRLGDRLSELDVQDRHRLRVQLKKLRYACEFFRSAFPDQRLEARRYLDLLEELQDVLGALNDFATAERLLAEILVYLDGEAAGPQVGASGFVAGWTASRAERELETLPLAWAAFAAVAPFWCASREDWGASREESAATSEESAP